MRLYLIKRKSDGKFLCGINSGYSVHTGNLEASWSGKPGTFLKTPDGIARNLRRLCSTPYYDRTPPPGLSPACRPFWKEVGWRDFDAAKLSLYVVVMMDVDLVSMTATPAQDFVQLEAIENQPLTRRERMASSTAA